ncbi:MAG: hypothetical protein K2J85_07245 [Anaeroplasmataceae bacterium]|nr:hypothetical protein [Anaeroplasmataceae bacterium]
MKKVLYLFVLLFCFFSLVSCKDKMSLEEQEKQQIEEDWQKEHEGKLNYDAFLGEYNGYKILFSSSMLTAIGEGTIAGYKFIHPTLFTIYAYKDGNFSYLIDVYNEGMLEEKDIKSIHEAYLSYMKKVYPAFYEGMLENS